jgi:hypothetical protein
MAHPQRLGICCTCTDRKRLDINKMHMQRLKRLDKNMAYLHRLEKA